MSTTTTLRTAVCQFCGRRVPVTDPGPDRTPWLKLHRVGKGADLAGGQTRSTVCDGSLMATTRPAAPDAAGTGGRNG